MGRKLLFVQLEHEVPDDLKRHLTDRLNGLSSDYQFVVFGPSMNILTPEAACYSFTETIDSYSYTITAKTPSELIELMAHMRRKKSHEYTDSDQERKEKAFIWDSSHPGFPNPDPNTTKRGREFF